MDMYTAHVLWYVELCTMSLINEVICIKHRVYFVLFFAATCMHALCSVRCGLAVCMFCATINIMGKGMIWPRCQSQVIHKSLYEVSYNVYGEFWDGVSLAYIASTPGLA